MVRKWKTKLLLFVLTLPVTVGIVGTKAIQKSLEDNELYVALFWVTPVLFVLIFLLLKDKYTNKLTFSIAFLPSLLIYSGFLYTLFIFDYF